MKNLTIFNFEPTIPNMLQHVAARRKRLAKRAQHNLRAGSPLSRARAAKGKAILREGVWWLRRSISRSRLRRARLYSNVSLLAGYTQHAATNNVAICCAQMLRSFGRGLTSLLPK